MAHFDVKELEKRKKEDLQKLANELGLSDIGTKEELAKRIAAGRAATAGSTGRSRTGNANAGSVRNGHRKSQCESNDY